MCVTTNLNVCFNGVVLKPGDKVLLVTNAEPTEEQSAQDMCNALAQRFHNVEFTLVTSIDKAIVQRKEREMEFTD